MIEKLSKSEVKRRFKEVETTAQQIAEFSNKDIKRLPGSDFFHEEIRNTRGLKAGARKRQIKYLAKVMRDEPLEEILEYLAQSKGSKIIENQIFHEAERVRDAIINEAIEVRKKTRTAGIEWEPDWESKAIASTMISLPRLDEDSVRKSVYSYVKSRNSIHHKEMFRMIHSAVEYKQRETE